MAEIGRSKIDQSRQTQLVNIELNRQTQLKLLNAKFVQADTAKSSMGFISVISLSLLFGSFLVNDMIKLINHAYKNILEKLTVEHDVESRIQNTNRKVHSHIHVEIEKLYAEQLDARLDRVHLDLLKAVQRQNVKHSF